MKKFLLSLAAVASFSAFVYADVINVNFSTATTLPAAESETETSVTVGDVTFGMVNCKKGTYSNISYLQITGKNKTPKGYITFKFDKKLTGFTLTSGASGSTNVKVQLSAGGTAIGDPVQLTAVNTTFNFEIPEANQAAGTTYKLEVAEGSNYNAQMTAMSFTLDEAFSGGGTDPDPVDPTPTPAGTINIAKVTEFNVADSKFAFVFNEGVVETFAETLSYGYWIASTATLADNMTTNETGVFTIASTDNGYTITDKFGRIMGWNGTNWSFNAYASASEGNSYWDIAMVDGKVKISNKANASVYLCGKVYNSTYEMCPTDRADQTLPYLYKVTGDSSVSELAAEGVGEAVYYNLQGVKVAELESGLYIKVQGGKSSKVLVRK